MPGVLSALACALLITLPLLASCSRGTIQGENAPDESAMSKGMQGEDEAPSPNVDPQSCTPVQRDPSLPRILDFTSSCPGRVQSLVRRALGGLGFEQGSADGPQPYDKVFVGKHYLVWIDETGFAGKANGLFLLNGRGGEELDFTLADGDGRPVNFFVVAENGDGQWPAGYPGSEHIEYPNRTGEPGDGCDPKRDWCDQYSVNEAKRVSDPRIAWWYACRNGAPGWSQRFEPATETRLADGVKLVYEVPLVKEADGDGRYDGDHCHENWLFEDKVRRPVFLRLGYELHADRPDLDRTMQIRNPRGNPDFKGAMSLIGGFVVTNWPDAHYLKRINRYIRPDRTDVWDPHHALSLAGGAWTAHVFPPLPEDEVFGWLRQPVSLSVQGEYRPGRSAKLANVGPSDNDDVGFCLCSVHGGLELGGGLIHAGQSGSLPGGESTIEAVRRLTVPSAGASSKVMAHPFEAEGGRLAHKIGRAESDGWAAATSLDAAGHLLYGPYATDWGDGPMQAAFSMMVDNNTADDLPVVRMEIYDATTDTIVAARQVHRKEFRSPLRYQRFALNAELAGRSGHKMETRLWWYDVSYVRVDKVIVNAASDG